MDVSVAVDRHLAWVSNLAVKAFAHTLQVEPVQSQMGQKMILTGLTD